MTFPAQSPDLRRFPLVAGASRSVVRSPRSAAPRIRFLFVDSRVRFTLRSAYASRRTPCASLRSLRPGSGRTFTSKSSPMPGPPHQNGLPSPKPGKPLFSYLFSNWGGWVRTTNLLVNSQALCRLSYTPFVSARRPTARYSHTAAFSYTQWCAMFCARTAGLHACELLRLPQPLIEAFKWDAPTLAAHPVPRDEERDGPSPRVARARRARSCARAPRCRPGSGSRGTRGFYDGTYDLSDSLVRQARSSDSRSDRRCLCISPAADMDNEAE